PAVRFNIESKKINSLQPFEAHSWSGFFWLGHRSSSPIKNRGLKMGWDGRKDGLWWSAFGQALDADHAFLLTARTVSRIIGFQNSRFGIWKCNPKHPMDQRNRDLLGRASQDAKMPDSNQSPGQDMHGEPADKLQIVQAHLQLLGSLTVVFVAEGGLLLANVQNPVVGDRYFVGVSAQVLQQRFGMSKGPLRVYHPLLLEELIDQYFLRLDPRLEGFHILGPKDFAHRLDRKEVFSGAFGRLPFS